ncbi:MAG: FliM/FliN family flagellar motor switch protein [Puniceicoccales bacterium]|jgi:flagellar motor switch/type III secretory pathway protein FliN|nr:FliM/FliN family flagellar motor switch protein [Puniceicoccales bacterium]
MENQNDPSEMTSSDAAKIGIAENSAAENQIDATSQGQTRPDDSPESAQISEATIESKDAGSEDVNEQITDEPAADAPADGEPPADEPAVGEPAPAASSVEEIEQSIEEIKSQNDSTLTAVTPETTTKPEHVSAPAIDETNRQTKHADPDDAKLVPPEEPTEQYSKKPKHQVTLTFEIFDQKIPLSELETIDKGYVFSCDNPIESPVTICANGTPIGSGELVNVDGKTGVRILEIFDK